MLTDPKEALLALLCKMGTDRIKTKGVEPKNIVMTQASTLQSIKTHEMVTIFELDDGSRTDLHPKLKSLGTDNEIMEQNGHQNLVHPTSYY